MQQMMSEIYQRGPITCSIATPDEFTYGYRAGIWKDKSNSTIDDIDHDVEVVGKKTLRAKLTSGHHYNASSCSFWFVDTAL